MTKMFIKKEAKKEELGKILRTIAEQGCESITWTDVVFKEGEARCEAYSTLEGWALAKAGFIPA